MWMSGGSSGGVAAQLAANLKAAKIAPIDPATLSPVGYYNGDDLPASGNITTWANRGSGGGNAVPVSTPPTVQSWAGDASKKAANFNGTTNALTFVDSGTLTALSHNQSCTVIAILQSTGGQDEAIFTAGSRATNGFELVIQASKPAELYLISWVSAAVSTSVATKYSTATNPQRVKAVAFARDQIRGSGFFWDAGRVTPFVRPFQVSSVIANYTVGYIGSLDISAHYFAGQIRAFMVFPTVLTEAQIAGVSAFFNTAPKSLFYVGDSLIYGLNASDYSKSRPFRAEIALGGTIGWFVYNFGVSGSATPEFQQRYFRASSPNGYNTTPSADCQIDTAGVVGEGGYREESRPGVILFGAIGNDLYYGATPAQALARLAAYVAQAARDGFIVVSSTTVQRGPSGAGVWPSPGGLTYAQFEAARLASNTLQVANAGKIYGNAISDVASLPHAADATNLTYFAADQVHWTDALYDEAAVLDAATINALAIT